MGKTRGSQAGDLRKTANEEKAQKGKSPRQYRGDPCSPPRAGNQGQESRTLKRSQQTSATRTELLPDRFCPWRSPPCAPPLRFSLTEIRISQSLLSLLKLRQQRNKEDSSQAASAEPHSALRPLGEGHLPLRFEAPSILLGSPVLFHFLGGCGSSWELLSPLHLTQR